jgi:hypothetical protein
MSEEYYRCGWCGAPTDKEGEPLTMSQIGLSKHISRWNNAKKVSGGCCNNPLGKD